MLSLSRLAVALSIISVVGCWETRTDQDRGSVLGFDVGSSKQDAFAQAIRSQKRGLIENLELIGGPAETYDEKYKGTPILPGDLPRVIAVDEWHLARPKCNCWLRLVFRNNRLDRIEEHEWIGPTE